MALDGERKRKRKKETIGNDELPAVLDAMRAAKFFTGLDAKHGYGKNQPLNAGRRLYVRKLLKDVRAHFDVERDPNGKIIFREARPVAYYEPRNKNQKENARESLGLESSKWRKFPVPLLQGYKGDAVKIRASTSANELGLAVDYPDWGLRHYFLPFDQPAILRRFDFSNDEISTKDGLIEAYQEWAAEKFARFDDGNSWFRLTTKYGDVSATKYGPTANLRTLLNQQLAPIINKYYSPVALKDDIEIEAIMQLTGVSVYRKISENLRKVNTTPLMINEFNRPKKARKKSKKRKMKKRK